jgi:hypothetical protein
VGFSTNPAIAEEALSFILSPRNALPQTMQFLTLYPTNFTALDETLACSHYEANQLVTCINQDVPTYFYAVQRSRLPMIAMPLGRGLSDTDRGEVNQNNSTKKHKNWRFLAHPTPSMSDSHYWLGVGLATATLSSPQNSSQHFHFVVSVGLFLD